MIPRTMIGQPASSAFVGSDVWHVAKRKFAEQRESIKRALLATGPVLGAIASGIEAAGVTSSEFSASLMRLEAATRMTPEEMSGWALKAKRRGMGA